jgi:malate dehydrogenase (oxaloacetate-decarboxylating)/malate dehydrogenase (oxaloacetate-decarboxylating)(NADP+)
MRNFDEKAIDMARKNRGKIEIKPKVRIKSFEDFSVIYTPGVAAVSRLIKDKKEKYLTYKWNSVAIVTDGTRILGLGNIGPDAAMPVMEGKALLFKYLGGVDAVPITLGTTDADKIVETVKAIAPSFGGINLEDIESPKAFDVLEKLQKELNIPVWHDDNQGTAAAALGAFINALKLTNRDAKDARIVFIGAGTANLSILRFFRAYGVDPKKVVVADSKGVLYRSRSDESELKVKNKQKYSVMHETNAENFTTVEEAVKGADAIIAASTKGTVKEEWIRSMSKDPIVFALANPNPDISEEEALRAGAKIYASGRSDMPNQVNNSLVFPGVFRGVLDVQAKKVTDTMAIAASLELAKYVEEKGLRTDYIVPRMDEREIYYRIAAGVGVAAQKEHVAESNMSYEEIYESAKKLISTHESKRQL